MLEGIGGKTATVLTDRRFVFGGATLGASMPASLTDVSAMIYAPQLAYIYALHLFLTLAIAASYVTAAYVGYSLAKDSWEIGPKAAMQKRIDWLSTQAQMFLAGANYLLKNLLQVLNSAQVYGKSLTNKTQDLKILLKGVTKPRLHVTWAPGTRFNDSNDVSHQPTSENPAAGVDDAISGADIGEVDETPQISGAEDDTISPVVQSKDDLAVATAAPVNSVPATSHNPAVNIVVSSPADTAPALPVEPQPAKKGSSPISLALLWMRNRGEDLRSMGRATVTNGSASQAEQPNNTNEQEADDLKYIANRIKHLPPKGCKRQERRLPDRFRPA